MPIRRARRIKQNAVVAFLLVHTELHAIVARDADDRAPGLRQGIFEHMLQTQAPIRRAVIALERTFALEHRGYHKRLTARSGTHVEHIHSRLYGQSLSRKHRSLVQKIRFQSIIELKLCSTALAFQRFQQRRPALAINLFKVIEKFHSTNIDERCETRDESWQKCKIKTGKSVKRKQTKSPVKIQISKNRPNLRKKSPQTSIFDVKF